MANQESVTASGIAKEVAKKTEIEILNQLNEHISRGLIVIEQTQPLFVSDPFDPCKIEIRTAVRVKLKEQEYIQNLEAENKELKDILHRIGMFVGEKK